MVCHEIEITIALRLLTSSYYALSVSAKQSP